MHLNAVLGLTDRISQKEKTELWSKSFPTKLDS